MYCSIFHFIAQSVTIATARHEPHVHKQQIIVANVAQSVRAPDCGPGGRGFNSRHSPQVFLFFVY